MRRVALLVLVTGCSQIFGLDTPEVIDAPSAVIEDAPRDAQGGTCIDRWMQGPQFGPVTPVTGVNTGNQDRAPFLTADGLTLYYVHENDIFVSSRSATTEQLGAGTRDDQLSSGSNDNRIYVAANRQRAFLSSNRPNGSGAMDLWRAARSSETDPWTIDQLYLGALNEAGDQTDPTLSEDLLRIYFTTKGGTGEKIHYAERAATSLPFNAARSVVELAGPIGNDTAPSISADERVIVFATNRDGNQDLWYATRTSLLVPFDAPQRLMGVNTENRSETEPHLTGDGCALYFASDRAASMDIYQATLLD